MIVAGKLEVTAKITELPKSSTDKNKWHEFFVNCGGIKIRVHVKPKVWNKLLYAHENYPMWVASITGKIGEPIPGGFNVIEPAIQVYEKKPKSPKEEISAVEN